MKKFIILITLSLSAVIFIYTTQTLTEPATQMQLCTVYSVSPDKTEITMETPNGNLYTFYTDGCTDCTIGSQWEVTFNEDMEIISVE
jgi:hypothetical protein